MLKIITSPTAVTVLLMLAGATAIPTALTYKGELPAINALDVFHIGVGLFTLGVVFSAVQIIFKIRKWEHFARIKAVGKLWIFLLMNFVTLALFPAASIYLRCFMQLHAADWGTSDTLAIPLVGMWLLAFVALVATNLFLLLALPRTTLPAPMRIRYAHTSKELNAWRVAFITLLLLDIIYLALSIIMGAVMGVIAATVYMYVIFSLHAGKIMWKEARWDEKASTAKVNNQE
jgi:hypothetical protein